VALHAQGDTFQALHAFERALLLAEPEHYMRLFLDEGVPVRDLLRRAGSQGITPQYVATLLAVPAGMKEQRASKQQPLIEPFSERELDVLRLIREGYSNQEIARELVIALGTVKAHTASLYRKLNVATRTQAVARATALNLL
jgi:LuxR family maltose regulon positive regulatory protein